MTITWMSNIKKFAIIQSCMSGKPISWVIPVARRRRCRRRRCRRAYAPTSHPLPSRSLSPHFSSVFCPPQDVLFRTPTYSLACSISAWKRKGNGCYAGYPRTIRLAKMTVRKVIYGSLRVWCSAGSKSS